MSLSTQIMDTMKEAMKAKDTVALEALRAIKSELLLAQTASGSKEEISETLNDLVTLAENDEFFSELERKNNQAEIHKTIKKYIERKI